MEVVICAMAKNEHKYINEWVAHYVKLGIDKIYLYDNDDLDKPFIGDFIDKKYLNKVVIKNISLASVMAMGANKDSMKINFNNIDYVRFKDQTFTEEVFSNRMKTLTVYGRVNLNTFAGKTTTQVFIDDYDLEDEQEDPHKYDF